MRVSIRADTSETAGIGHLTRCLALADTIHSYGGEVSFVLRQIAPALHGRLSEQRHDVRLLNLPQCSTYDDDAQASAAAIDSDTDWLIVDHYGLDHQWEGVLRTRGVRLLAIDDLADRSHSCDTLLDPGYGRKAQAYAALVPASASLLLGTRYALLKPGFSRDHNRAPSWSRSQRVHVFFGGGITAHQWLARYCERLLVGLPGIELHAVGPGDPEAMLELERRFAGRINWQEHVEDMAAHMVTCGVAVGAPGSATWERACVGLPSALVATSPNQIAILQELDRSGFCRYLGAAWELESSEFVAGIADFLSNEARLRELRTRGVENVDGRGTERIVRHLADQGKMDD